MKTGLEIVVDYLQSVPAWYLATSEDGQPHVRPFSFAACAFGRVWFCTSTRKDVYQEMRGNPKVELSAWKPGRGWVVMRGEADLADEAPETIRRAGFAHMRALGEDFTGSDDPTLTFFTLKGPRAWLCDIDGSRHEIGLERDYDQPLEESEPAEAVPSDAAGPSAEPDPEPYDWDGFDDVD